jgi:hypothetical protein
LNGVVVLTTARIVPASLMPPFPSRTLTRKFIVRAADGRSSPVIQLAAQIEPVADAPLNITGARSSC